ncbi:LysR family transcriptional regulator [Actinoplanes sp. KI2]|uniref:LysR family transcriptional regulator n=1 Tax=Actinoplanes sp. KI2 TaxID=2983315 RepID=UPI0021D5B4AB|nr:LysR family transcriptional regulator [Actinoplanes sp. KI2]MCU7727861.1 LysR family transcriptional regulator [Actinoplanes sp. KI2]
MVSLDLLRTFLAVYREGSLTRAARRLGLSQPAVTIQLRLLEERLGRPLFTRLPRGVAPTPAADLLARRIADPLDQLAAFAAAGLDEPADSFGGIVHLGAPVELVTARVLPALADLVGRGLELRVTIGVSDELLQGLRSGALDLAVLTARPRRRGLRAEPLLDEEFALVAAEPWTTRLAGADDLAAALAAAPLIAYAEELPIVRRYWQSVFEVRPALQAALVVPNLHAVLAAVRAGAGYSVLPTYLCADDLAANRLTVLHEPPVPPLNTLFLASRADTALTGAVNAVRERLLTRLVDWPA